MTAPYADRCWSRHGEHACLATNGHPGDHSCQSVGSDCQCHVTGPVYWPNPTRCSLATCARELPPKSLQCWVVQPDGKRVLYCNAVCAAIDRDARREREVKNG